MKNQDNNFKRALLKELTGFSSKDKEGNAAATDDDDDDDYESFDFVPAPEKLSANGAAVTPLPKEPTPAPVVETPDFNYMPKPNAEPLATTTISKATVINGGIQTRENITIEGIVNGDITSKGKVLVKGKVEGNVAGYDVDVSAEELAGDINCESKAVIHASTKLKGNLYCGKATIVGTVEGNITAKDSIELLDNAVVYGDIKATAISVSEGAVIYGMVTIGRTKPDSATF